MAHTAVSFEGLTDVEMAVTSAPVSNLTVMLRVRSMSMRGVRLRLLASRRVFSVTIAELVNTHLFGSF